ncbi:calmodulin-beta [Rhipicephalus sanguineus]|uniref:EF-hand domain-containing protein n=1 Tax=Rhipicephalus sanguineus TaxID=34632 RepID=A0A9D4Q131_RHISA|nr:calmodulin-beta [Rhipicephalus sanguineus]KAH7962573.1 hypothetical protein HPB52_016955 [Rhipicephalus sanguineus]
MKRFPPTHSPQGGQKPTTATSTVPSASQTAAQSALKTHLSVPDTGGVGDCGRSSSGPRNKTNKGYTSPGGVVDQATAGSGGPQISEEAIVELRELFALFDRDGDGEISTEDLAIMTRAFGQNPTEVELKNMIAQVDTDDSGTVDFPEFVAKVRADTLTTPTEEETRKLFKIFDRDGDGFITADELRHFMAVLGEQLTDEQVAEMIREADMDGDVQISYDEFSALVTSAQKSK